MQQRGYCSREPEALCHMEQICGVEHTPESQDVFSKNWYPICVRCCQKAPTEAGDCAGCQGRRCSLRRVVEHSLAKALSLFWCARSGISKPQNHILSVFGHFRSLALNFCCFFWREHFWRAGWTSFNLCRLISGRLFALSKLSNLQKTWLWLPWW